MQRLSTARLLAPLHCLALPRQQDQLGSRSGLAPSMSMLSRQALRLWRGQSAHSCFNVCCL